MTIPVQVVSVSRSSTSSSGELSPKNWRSILRCCVRYKSKWKLQNSTKAFHILLLVSSLHPACSQRSSTTFNTYPTPTTKVHSKNVNQTLISEDQTHNTLPNAVVVEKDSLQANIEISYTKWTRINRLL